VKARFMALRIPASKNRHTAKLKQELDPFSSIEVLPFNQIWGEIMVSYKKQAAPLVFGKQ